MRSVVGMRAGVVVAALAIVAAIAVGVAHVSDSHTQHRTTGTSGSQTASASAPRVVTPPKPTELRGVLADWTDANPHASAVVGVQVGSRAAVFSSSAPLTDATSFRLAVPGIAGSATTPDALMHYASDYLRAHAQGARDLASSYFRIGHDGHGRGVEGFTSDGFCARAPHGCAPGTTFFAVGVVGSGPGGAAGVVYDPGADVGIVAVSRARHADLTDLVERAFLLTTLGRAGYERAVSNTARIPAPSVTHR
jgi:hypothetical protein